MFQISVGFIRSKLVSIIYIPLQLTTIQIDDLDKLRVSCVKILQLNVSLKHFSRFLNHSKIVIDNYSLSAFKWHKSNIKNLLMKSSDIVFIFLPAFYLVIWLMTSPKNFEKMSILKIWQLVFFWCVETHFGEK